MTMLDEFSSTYGVFCRGDIEDKDIGPVGPLVELLRSTYVDDSQGRLLFSEPQWRPSLVARSDAELYDVESPRWAKRVHAVMQTKDKDKERLSYLGFVDIRALNAFRERLDQDKKSYVAPKELTGSHLICGACLVPPSRLKEFRFPTSCELGVYHNELAGWRSTAFASPMAQWGGWCSQACAYMATHSMIEHGARVLGISDITLASSHNEKNEPTEDYPIPGLTLKKLAELFRSEYFGLNAFWQRIPFRSVLRDPDSQSLNLAAFIMSCYIRQGFPVILSVKVARLIEANPGAYPKNLRRRFERWTDEEKDSHELGHHCVLLVGFTPRTKTEKYWKFVYHDSFCRPYMTISIDKLATAAADQFNRNKKPDAFEFIVPVPRCVGTPLVPDFSQVRELHVGGNTYRDFKDKCQPLLPSARYWEEVIEKSEKREVRAPRSAKGRFDLDRVKGEKKFLIVSPRDFYDRYVSVNVVDHQKALAVWQRIENSLPKSLWIQEFRPSGMIPDSPYLADRAIGSLWAWSGERPYPDSEDWQKPILQACRGTLFVDYRSCHGQISLRNCRGLDVRKSALLEIGAITTFDTKGMQHALEMLASRRIPNVDLYAFQEADLQRYYPMGKTVSALHEIADHPDPESIAEEIYKDVKGVCERYEHSFCIRGFATYIPEISSLNETERLLAVKALENVIRMAGTLQTPEYKKYFDTRFVEIVAGTRLYDPRIQAVGEPDTAGYHVEVTARRACHQDKRDALLRSLATLSQAAHDNRVSISIEVEPGLLPFIADSEDIHLLVDGIETPGALPHPETIGINIDCCHMQLCGIAPSDIASDNIRNRICHIHIGDIGPGHLSDLVTGVMQNHETYHEWLALFARVATELPRSKQFPDFSCCLSVELEACRTPEMVGAAYHRTKSLLERYLRQRAYGDYPV